MERDGRVAPGTLPEGYPAGYETDVVLADGATAHVRPIRPDDGARIVEFHGRQSPQSIYYRFFSPRPRLTEREVEQMTSVDYVDRMALVAVRGEELIGVARYDRWRHRSEAEVAFFVDDANHGRGLATVLLEHLAVRAREVGLTGFTASVLPENRKMIGVFTQAGFESATRFADGIVEVRLGIVPTPEAEAAIDARARSSASEAVRRLLSPRSIAVIGASRARGKVGYEVVRNLQRGGYQGPVYPVNPTVEHVRSIRTFPSILDIPDEVDLAIVTLPAAQVAAAVEECGRKQVYGVVVISAGFAEIGPDGAALEAEVLRVARSWGIRLVGPNGLGLVNTDPQVQMTATFVHVAPTRGAVALLSESGMVGAAIMARATEEGIGLSSFLALGNRADVSGNDLLQYWEADPRTEVVCLYIESFGNARHFSRVARRLTRAKPVVAVKAAWHPGAAVGERGAIADDALLRQTGVIRVRSLPDLLDTTRMLTCQPLPRGRRVAVIGNAGGSLAIAADAVVSAGLELAALVEPTRAAIEEVVGRPVLPGDLVDLDLRADGETYGQVCDLLAADPGVDAILAVFAPSLGGTATEVRDTLDAASRAHRHLAIAGCFYGDRPAPLPDHGRPCVPVYDAIDRAARALERVASYAAWLEEEPGAVPELDDELVARVRGVVASALERGASRLSIAELAEVLEATGLEAVATASVRSLEEALVAAERIGYPIALKAAGRDSMAKTEASGLALDLADEGDLRGAWARMSQRFGPDLLPALVQAMVDPGLDVAVAVHDHPEVGPVLELGPGGAHAALDRAGELVLLPLGDAAAARLVDRSRLGPYLSAEASTQLQRVLMRIGAVVEAVPEIVEWQANPVIVSGDRAVAIEVSIGVAPAERAPLALRHLDPTA
jgi:acyl-CoA synthetase (NDP forming)/RimJ/RimL family protein N-acetyltransferase